jgi:hydrogenase maturation factor
MKMARIKIAGAIKEVSIGLLTGVRIDDMVLLCDGVAIARVDEQTSDYVSGDSR